MNSSNHTCQIAASTILRKLETNSNHNKLYQAFHALGCAVRSGFLLQYIQDAALRATIHAATNKSEAFNGFAKWLSFGGEGVIASNNREEQRKIIKYNHLIANCLIFYNVSETNHPPAENFRCPVEDSECRSSPQAPLCLSQWLFHSPQVSCLLTLLSFYTHHKGEMLPFIALVAWKLTWEKSRLHR